MTILHLCLPPLSVKQTSVHGYKALIWLISECLSVAYPPLATCISHCWLYPSVRHCQGRISGDHCTLCLRVLPGEALCQAGFIRVEILLFKEHFVSIHSNLSGQAHGRSKGSAVFDFQRMEREYRSSRESWQEVLLSIILCSYSERPQTPLHLFYSASVFVTQRHCHLLGQPQVTPLNAWWKAQSWLAPAPSNLTGWLICQSSLHTRCIR